jgi:hypothetical protein
MNIANYTKFEKVKKNNKRTCTKDTLTEIGIIFGALPSLARK